MSKIRLVLAEIPQLLRDILRSSLTAQEDVTLAGEVASRAELLRLLATEVPDAVVLGCRQSDVSEVGRQLVRASPFVKLFAVTDEGRKAFLYELHPRILALGELSPRELIKAVRAALFEDRKDEPENVPRL